MSQRPLNFTTELERQQWFIEHADLFTVIRFRNRRYERHEYPSLELARTNAQRMVSEDPTARLMLYAVHGASDTYVETISV